MVVVDVVVVAVVVVVVGVVVVVMVVVVVVLVVIVTVVVVVDVVVVAVVDVVEQDLHKTGQAAGMRSLRIGQSMSAVAHTVDASQKRFTPGVSQPSGSIWP